MYQMDAIRPSIERLSLAIANSLRLEIAIFDRDQLFFCTPTYLKKKGRTVHSPSIQEVMNSGSVLVNTPGEMPSCIGCRFKNHCPATIEILCCIRVDTQVVGVAALTSFTKEGQKRIQENTSLYLDAVTELGTLMRPSEDRCRRPGQRQPGPSAAKRSGCEQPAHGAGRPPRGDPAV